MPYEHVKSEFIDRRSDLDVLDSAVDKESAQFSLLALAHLFKEAGILALADHHLSSNERDKRTKHYEEISKKLFDALSILERHHWDLKAVFETATNPEKSSYGLEYERYSKYTKDEIKAFGKQPENWEELADFNLQIARHNFKSSVDFKLVFEPDKHPLVQKVKFREP